MLVLNSAKFCSSCEINIIHSVSIKLLASDFNDQLDTSTHFCYSHLQKYIQALDHNLLPGQKTACGTRSHVIRPHQIDLMFHGLIIPKTDQGGRQKKEMNIIIKPHTESQHTTKVTLVKHYNILLDHMAIFTSDLDH